MPGDRDDDRAVVIMQVDLGRGAQGKGGTPHRAFPTDVFEVKEQIGVNGEDRCPHGEA